MLGGADFAFSRTLFTELVAVEFSSGLSDLGGNPRKTTELTEMSSTKGL